MEETLSVWREQQQVAAIAVLAVIYVTVAGFEMALARNGWFPTDLTFGLTIASAVVLGPIVAWGAAIGYLVTDVLSGTFGPSTAVGYLAHFMLVVTAYRLWGTFGIASSRSRPGARHLRSVLEYVLVASTATAFATGVTAWGNLLFAQGTFPLVVMNSLFNRLLSALTVGVVGLFAVADLADRYEFRYKLPTEPRAGGVIRGRIQPGLAALLLSGMWCTVGYFLGAIFQAAELAAPHVLANRVGRWILPILEAAGPGGRNLQILSGLVFFAVFFIILIRAGLPARNV